MPVDDDEVHDTPGKTENEHHRLIALEAGVSTVDSSMWVRIDAGLDNWGLYRQQGFF